MPLILMTFGDIRLELQGVLEVDAGAELWNSTDGLCGSMDGRPENDLSYNSVMGFANKWLNNELNDICESPITETINVSESVEQEALQFCSFINDDRFKDCGGDEKINAQAYVDACKMDYSRCVSKNGTGCGCSSIAAYAEQCFGKDRTVSWRDDNMCRE